MKINPKTFIRVLFIIFSFHFSGMNEGFASIVVTPGKADRIHFAPIAVEKVVSVLNPIDLCSQKIIREISEDDGDESDPVFA